MKSTPDPQANSPWITVGLVGVAALAILALIELLKDKRNDSTSRASLAVHTAPGFADRPVRDKDAAPESTDATVPPMQVPPLTAASDGLEALRAILETPTAVPNEAVLQFRSGAAYRAFQNVARNFGLDILTALPTLNSVRVSYSDLASLRRYLQSTHGSPNAPQLEPNAWLSTPQIQPSKAPDNQGGSTAVGESFLQAINAVGDRSTWGSEVTVAVLDTGLQAHPTFGEGKVTHIDLVQDGKRPHGHGTSVASLIAGQDDRVPGVAPGVTLLDIRVADDKGISVTTVLAQGVIAAADHGAQVINISLGGYDDSALLRSAIDYAVSKGALVVAAAGNENFDQLAYPAALEGVISVGSVDKNQRQAWFSNSGKGLDFTAPGVGLPVAWDTDKMANASGTSQSAAIVSGVVATYLSWGVPPSEIQRRLMSTARTTGAPAEQVGHGVIWLQQ
jgi:hypothetical protein